MTDAEKRLEEIRRQKEEILKKMTDKTEPEKIEQENIYFRSEYKFEGKRYEQVFDPYTRKTEFVCYDAETGTSIRKPFIETEKAKIYPITDDFLVKNLIVLPQIPNSYGSIKELDEEITNHITQWSDVSEEHLKILPGYIRFTWIADASNTSPYLRAIASFGQGKTRYLNTIGGICRKPLFCGGSVTPAVIFRLMDFWKGTLILDEFNLEDKSDDTKEVIKILNQGFEKGSGVLRCDPDDHNKVLAFDSYGPKIFASTKEYRSLAFESRCLREILQPSSEKPVQLSKEFYTNRLKLQNKLLLYRFKTIDKINGDEINRFNFGSIQPRIRQVYGPLLLVYPENDPMRDELVLTMTNRSNEVKSDNTDTMEGLVFNTYLLCENSAMTVVTPKNICDYIKERNGESFKELKPNSVGKVLRKLGFTVTVKTIDNHTFRIVTLNDKVRGKLLETYDVTG